MSQNFDKSVRVFDFVDASAALKFYSTCPAWSNSWFLHSFLATAMSMRLCIFWSVCLLVLSSKRSFESVNSWSNIFFNRIFSKAYVLLRMENQLLLRSRKFLCSERNEQCALTSNLKNIERCFFLISSRSKMI